MVETRGRVCFFLQQPGHVPGRRPGGQTPGLQHEDFAAPKPGRIYEGQRYVGGFSAARRRVNYATDAGMQEFRQSEF